MRLLLASQEREPQLERLVVAAEPLLAVVIGKAVPVHRLGNRPGPLSRVGVDAADENRKPVSRQVPRAELVAVPGARQDADAVGLNPPDALLRAGRHRDELPRDGPPVLDAGRADVAGRNAECPPDVPHQVRPADVGLLDPQKQMLPAAGRPVHGQLFDDKVLWQFFDHPAQHRGGPQSKTENSCRPTWRKCREGGGKDEG